MSAVRPVLEADGLGKRFGGRTVLASAGFSVHRGRVTALLGRNGAGKSTLLRIAVGRVRPEWGRVLFHGELVRRPALWRLARRGLMYVSQGSALTRHFTVRQHLDAIVRAFPRGGSLSDAVGLFDLAPILDRRPGALSGGERQRASLAMALLRGPSCLLWDEPFAGVAPVDRQLVAEGIRTLREQGSGILLTGHDVEDLFAVSDDVIWVTAGTTHWLGSPTQAAAHHQFRREYLGAA